MDNHGVDVGNIKSRLNNGGRYQYVNLAVDEFIHDFFQLVFLHLPMGKLHGNVRD